MSRVSAAATAASNRIATVWCGAHATRAQSSIKFGLFSDVEPHTDADEVGRVEARGLRRRQSLTNSWLVVAEVGEANGGRRDSTTSRLSLFMIFASLSSSNCTIVVLLLTSSRSIASSHALNSFEAVVAARCPFNANQLCLCVCAGCMVHVASLT